jgi:protein SCO1/2
VPRKLIAWIVIAFAVLGLGGAVGERLLGNTGVGTPTTTPSSVVAPGNAAPATPTPPGQPPVGASLPAFLGLKHLGTAPAAAIDLVDQQGAPWTLADAAGKVVVLAFVDADCTDICPDIGQELSSARALLGPQASGVQFVVVNTDPSRTVPTTDPPALAQTSLGNLADVTFLTGSLARLNAVWASYGITVAVDRKSHAVSHNDLLYFIDARGRLRSQATPFANEDQLGSYSLGTADEQRFALGIADTAASLSTSP